MKCIYCGKENEKNKYTINSSRDVMPSRPLAAVHGILV